MKRGSSVVAKIPLHLKAGYHVNSNTPSDEYLIPLRLTWDPGKLAVEGTVYPKPQMETLSFSEKPLSVFSGTFVVEVRFKAAANAPAGSVTMMGKLRYQACNSKECLPPKIVDVPVPVEIQ